MLLACRYSPKFGQLEYSEVKTTYSTTPSVANERANERAT